MTSINLELDAIIDGEYSYFLSIIFPGVVCMLVCRCELGEILIVMELNFHC